MGNLTRDLDLRSTPMACMHVKQKRDDLLSTSQRGVVRPRLSSDLRPLGGGQDVDAEQVGEERGGDLAGELRQRGAACGGAVADAVEAAAEELLVDRAAGDAIGEEPSGFVEPGGGRPRRSAIRPRDGLRVVLAPRLGWCQDGSRRLLCRW